jgi:hypothetical protein
MMLTSPTIPTATQRSPAEANANGRATPSTRKQPRVGRNFDGGVAQRSEVMRSVVLDNDLVRVGVRVNIDPALVVEIVA